jgi:flagellar biosynthesis protein FliQ
MSKRSRYLSLFGIAPVAGLLALVLGVGVVAMYAESQKQWTAYHLMEQAMAFGARVVVPLIALALVGSFVLVTIAPRFER